MSTLRFKAPLAVAIFLVSCVRGLCYVMPAFEHKHIKWTRYGPFGLGDMEGTTYFYFGYHIQFSLPGTAAIWMWLGPLLVVSAAFALVFVARRYLRWSLAFLARKVDYAHHA